MQRESPAPRPRGREEAAGMEELEDQWKGGGLR